jgi:hypothetical protein
MADVRAPFPSLVDTVTGAAAVLSKSQAGDAASGKTGSTAFAYKDVSGNLILPSLNAAGAVPVAPPGVPVSGSTPTPVTGSTSAFQTVASATLTASKTYSQIEGFLSCYNDFIGQIVKSDNATETVIGWIVGGPGQTSAKYLMISQSFSSGATGTQLLLLKAKNLQVISDLYGTVAAVQT